MTITRRDLLRVGASAAGLAALPRSLSARIWTRPELLPPIQDPRVKALAMRAIEAARAAGATYADARLTHTRVRGVTPSSAGDSGEMGVGVRALVNGYWGFSSGPVWSADEMARLAREAVNQAKTNSLGKPRVVDLAPASPVANGNWVMPVKLDPFEVSPFEIMDLLASLSPYALRLLGDGGDASGGTCSLLMQEKAFASTDGNYCTQRLYRTSGGYGFSKDREGRDRVGRSLDLLTPAAAGWEHFRQQPLREEIRRLTEEIKEDLKLPIKPIEVGRYDTVMDATSVAALVDGTFGRATELDRALGYEANADGTSYLNDPFKMVGSYQAGAPLVTLLANRSELGGAATVRWDDEGVAPEDFTLVKDGVLADFQTTRESAGWMREYYAKGGTPFRSHGCANAPSGIEPAIQRTPNLALKPGNGTEDFESLIAGISTGIAIGNLDPDMDFQNLNGLGRGRVYEVKKGKRVARLSNAGVLFRGPDLWKGVLALGGEGSARRYGMETRKGEPAQRSYHSVTAVPAAFKQLTVIDALRKA